MRLPLVTLIVLLIAAPARAGLLYLYDGDPVLFATGVYTSGVTQIDGRFVLSEGFVIPTIGEPMGTVFVDVTSGLDDWSFTDGVQTLTPTNSTATIQIGFNLDGTPIVPGSVPDHIGWWQFTISNATGGMTAAYFAREYQTIAWIGDQANPSSRIFVTSEYLPDIWGGTAGTWTVENTPEPAALALLILGAIVLGVRRHSTSLG
jgi:hypothetical protein